MIKRVFYLEQIKPFMHTDLIKILIGVRRSGKSTLLKQIIDELKTMKLENIRMRTYYMTIW